MQTYLSDKMSATKLENGFDFKFLGEILSLRQVGFLKEHKILDFFYTLYDLFKEKNVTTHKGRF